MWKKILIGEKMFLIKLSANTAKNHEILLSDFRKVWEESLHEQEMLNRCKELNPLCEAEPLTLIKMIKEIIDPEKSNSKKELIEVGNQLTITFSSYMAGVIFKFQFILLLTTPEKYNQLLTFPLLQMVEELQARQKILCDLLKKKDNEINEYKMEGVTITRKNAITEPFNEQKFFESCSSHDAEKRLLDSLKCPFSFFEESCSKLYEECTKRRKGFEESLSQKKIENIKEEHDKKEITGKIRRKKTNELIYDDYEIGSDDDDSDETNFPNPKFDIKSEKSDDETCFLNDNIEVKPTIKAEVKNPVILKKRKLLKNL